MFKYSAVVAILLIAGCKNMAPSAPVNIAAAFDENETARLNGDGTNIVKGNGFMRQVGGGVVTCAGATVYLFPATSYAKERVKYLYGRVSGGYNGRRANPTFVPDPPSYSVHMRTAKCDAQGNFLFDRVRDGEFYVQTTIAWAVPGRLLPEGGNIIQHITVTPDRPVNVVLSQ